MDIAWEGEEGRVRVGGWIVAGAGDGKVSSLPLFACAVGGWSVQVQVQRAGWCPSLAVNRSLLE